MTEATPSSGSSSSTAEHMRLHRKRRRAYLRQVSISLHVTGIEELVRWGYLQPDERENAKALQNAVSDLLSVALDISR